ncbi:MAG: enhanced serine sensitivity protein SseB C-terminal domain-containing protein [Floccifex sp.]
MAEFNNERLREALRDFKSNPKSQEYVNQMGRTLQTSSILIPAIWDKEPAINAKGQMLFPENTNFQFAIVKTKDESQYIIAFTSNYDYKHWDENHRFKPMVLPVVKFLELIQSVPSDIKGILFDPTDVQISLNMSFLTQVRINEEKRKASLQKKEFQPDEKLRIKEAVNVDDFKASMIRFAKKESSIQAIYLKERLVENQDSHWLILVDMDPENPSMFQALGQFIHPFDQNKSMEFMFATHPIAQKIISTTKPVYIRENDHDIS